MRKRSGGKGHNVISDFSGFEFKRSEMRYTWDGYLVHYSEWEPKNPQENIRLLPEKTSVEGVRLGPDDEPMTLPTITTDQMI